MAGNDPHCPEMRVVGLMDERNQVRGISFFEKYDIDGKIAWLNTYAITDDQYKGNELVAKALHDGAKESLRRQDEKQGRKNSIVVAEVNSTTGFNGEALHENKAFADAEWTLKTGALHGQREEIIPNGKPGLVALGGNVELIQAKYNPPNLDGLPQGLEGATASEIAHLFADKPLVAARAGEQTGAEPLALAAYKTDGSKIDAGDVGVIHKLMAEKLPKSVILANGDAELPEHVVNEVLANHREKAGYGDMDKDLTAIREQLAAKNPSPIIGGRAEANNVLQQRVDSRVC